MYHELYIDLFFLENLMMDSLLLLALDHILKCGTPRGKLFHLCGDSHPASKNHEASSFPSGHK